MKENSKDITLTDAEMQEIQSILDNFTVSGGRYHPDHSAMLNG